MIYFPEIAFGTYEEFILGYKPEIINDKGKIKLKQSFASHSHQASIRCVAAHGQYLVSSGADEYINVYDLLIREVLTIINFHSSTVTCLEFVPDGSHLISGDQNGDIAIFTTRDWSLVKYWKEAHKSSNGVLSISVHPTGGLLMTAGADNILRFWNLIKGRQAYATNFAKKCSIGNSLSFAKWSKKGTYYAVCIGKLIEVYNTEAASLCYEIKSSVKVSCMEFLTSDILIIGFEMGGFQIHHVKKKTMLFEKQCHTTRIKCLTTFSVENPNDQNKKLKYLITADSGGLLILWRLKIKMMVCTLLKKAKVDVDCRVTCLTTVQHEIKEET